MISYDEERRDLPCDQLYDLFMSAGWVREGGTDDMFDNFNRPFINSTLVVSAWDGGRLVGAVRLLSDCVIRSIVYDLVVAPEYRGQGIGRELLRRCRARLPNSELLVQTEKHIAPYYQQLGFDVKDDVFLALPTVYF